MNLFKPPAIALVFALSSCMALVAPNYTRYHNPVHEAHEGNIHTYVYSVKTRKVGIHLCSEGLRNIEPKLRPRCEVLIVNRGADLQLIPTTYDLSDRSARETIAQGKTLTVRVLDEDDWIVLGPADSRTPIQENEGTDILVTYRIHGAALADKSLREVWSDSM